MSCVFDRYIEFLDGTDCVFYYNMILKSREQHLMEQERCLLKAKALDELDLVCQLCRNKMLGVDNDEPATLPKK